MWLEKLRAMKEKSGLTTKEISIKAGLPEPTIEKIFSGVTKDPRLSTIQQLVHFFGYTLDDLDDKKNTPPEMGEADDILFRTLQNNFYALNEEGRERLVETSDDMVLSGKYIKSDSAVVDRGA